ncbi:MAG: Tim44 domain-containing protein, partial [Burkholderiaceae bacterium]|nr:Tim44 domain-containing protein [Burkholderiaceae bacterium]
MKKLLPALFVALLMVLHPDAEARRMGGGKSFGQQSSNVTQRNAAPATPAGPTQNAAAAKPGAPAAAPAAAAPKKPWGAML